MNLLGLLEPKTFWNAPYGSSELKTKIFLAFLVGVFLFAALFKCPTQLRKWIVYGVTLVSGLFYVVYWLYPQPIGRNPGDAPRNTFEAFGFYISDAQSRIADISNIVGGFLIGLGIISLLRVHLRRILKGQRDWGFSAVLVGSMIAMTVFGYLDYYQRSLSGGANLPQIEGVGWGPVQYGKDLLFDGLLQQMDAGMFSIIAFFILSAAYRAFRARSVEATILLITALLVILSLMPLFEQGWNSQVTSLTRHDPNSVLNNFRLTEIAKWLKDTVQTSSIRGIDFGVGVGLMAMGLRLWLSLEKFGGEG